MALTGKFRISDGLDYALRVYRKMCLSLTGEIKIMTSFI